ncbi:hypothetical protein GS610_08660 [Ruegeria sp. HKCCD6228]|uniref:hypothetical protein n=1 Tax=unclassified Ruegeria TaxID=2625375 RepID=UPI001487CAD0|nr:MULTISPECIES: hypothetical protein [unclassified Ruegeria]NOC83503.1 hypothetical protein [Ruegeria sp. HKCCD6428]NOD97277.1 hypothetical protein [Ruegeria sp. HKCCD6228]
MAEPITALAAPLMPFLDYLRPNKSPYVLVSVAILTCLLLPQNTLFESPFGWMYHIPIYCVIACTVVLSFLYRPPEVVRHNAKASGHLVTTTNLTEVSDDSMVDMDHQLKFSRSFCLICGLVSLYILFKSESRPFFEIFTVLYFVIVFHIAVFMGYLLFRSLREESINKFAVFQIGFITGISLLGTALSYDQINKNDYSILSNCTQNSLLILDNNENIARFEEERGIFLDGMPIPPEDQGFPPAETAYTKCDTPETVVFSGYLYEIDPKDITKRIDWKATNTIIFAIAWLAFMLFWVLRLKKFIRVVFVD